MTNEVLLRDGDGSTLMCECHHTLLQEAPHALGWARMALGTLRGRGDERNLPEPRSLQSQDLRGQTVPELMVSRKMR